MSAVAVQQLPLGLLPAFQQKRHAAAPPASITATPGPKQMRTPGIISLSKPLTPPRSTRRKVTPSSGRAADVFQPGSAPRPEPKSAKKARSRPTSDEDESPSKPRGRRPNNAPLPTPAASPVANAAKARRNPSRARQSPEPSTESDSPAPATPSPLEKPSGRLAKHRRGLTRVRESSWKAQGPLTAPLNGGFPSRPSHARSPSEALFNMSLDETDDEPQDMPILFGRGIRGGDKVYAGGKFQNGPDTTMLPAPSFLSGF
ncbi:hypothetical protein FRC12_013340 [Ceratobasidium sp. 428]|nr:hypothetical protein FRC12_013340 [Ceratobasidium sp. 428]